MKIFVFYTALSYYHKMHFIGLGHSLADWSRVVT